MTLASAASAPDVSVIMPAYNVARFIPRAIKSALAQEGVTVEAVVADDASTDATAETVARIAEGDPRVHLLRAERNGGAGAARNRALAAARGRWMAVLDADDAFAPGRLARLVRLAEAEGLDALSDLPLLYDLAAGEPGPHQLEASGKLETVTLRRLLETTTDPAERLNYGMLKPLFRHELVEKGLWRYPEEARHGEDFLAYFHAIRQGARYGLIHEAHYVFSTRLGQISGRYSPGSVTPVNYRAIAADTRRLAERVRAEGLSGPGIEADEIAAMLNRRIALLGDMDRAYGWNTLWAGAWRRHLAWLRRDPRNLGLMADEALRRLLRGRWLRRRLAGRRT